MREDCREVLDDSSLDCVWEEEERWEEVESKSCARYRLRFDVQKGRKRDERLLSSPTLGRVGTRNTIFIIKKSKHHRHSVSTHSKSK